MIIINAFVNWSIATYQLTIFLLLSGLLRFMILCDITLDVLECLQSKHTLAPSNIKIIQIHTGSPSMTTFSQDIRETIRSFSGSSGGSVNGLRPIHLQDLISNQAAEVGNYLNLSLNSLVNTFPMDKLATLTVCCFFSQSNCPYEKIWLHPTNSSKQRSPTTRI